MIVLFYYFEIFLFDLLFDSHNIEIMIVLEMLEIIRYNNDI
jgi:hypothetical protein